MDFHWWMLLPLIPLLGISFLAWRIVRVRRRARPFLQLSRNERLEFARLAVRDGRLPLVPRLVAAGAAAYLSLPVDLIPDFIPIVGHADDFLVVTLLTAVITRTIPAEALEELIADARRAAATQRAIPVN